jgi:hypothetical protein
MVDGGWIGNGWFGEERWFSGGGSGGDDVGI